MRSCEQRTTCRGSRVCQVQPSAWVCSLTAARSIFCSAHSFTKAKVNVQSTAQHDCNMAQPSEKKCRWAIGPLEHQASAGKLICVVLMRQSPMSQLSQWKQRLKNMMTLDDTSMYSMYRWIYAAPYDWRNCASSTVGWPAPAQCWQETLELASKKNEETIILSHVVLLPEVLFSVPGAANWNRLNWRKMCQEFQHVFFWHVLIGWGHTRSKWFDPFVELWQGLVRRVSHAVLDS